MVGILGCNARSLVKGHQSMEVCHEDQNQLRQAVLVSRPRVSVARDSLPKPASNAEFAS
jgi:hypothetical protein